MWITIWLCLFILSKAIVLVWSMMFTRNFECTRTMKMRLVMVFNWWLFHLCKHCVYKNTWNHSNQSMLWHLLYSFHYNRVFQWRIKYKYIQQTNIHSSKSDTANSDFIFIKFHIFRRFIWFMKQVHLQRINLRWFV